MNQDHLLLNTTAVPQSPRRFGGLLHVLTLGVIVPSCLGAFSAWHQLFDLCSHFRLQYLVLLSGLSVLLWRNTSPRWAAAACLAALHNLALVGPYYLPKMNAGYPSETISVISFNVHTANRRSADVLDYLQRKKPDVILLIEVDHRWIGELRALQQSYPFHVLSPQADNFGLAVFSRLPITRQDVLPLGPHQPASVWVELNLNNRPVGFLGIHPLPPMTPQMFANRNRQLAAVAEKVHAANLPVIVAGDFNATPWCDGFQTVLSTGLTDTARGFGIQQTWNSKLPPLGIPIDHVLASNEFITLRRAVGPSCGSDHYAVEAELGLP